MLRNIPNKIDQVRTVMLKFAYLAYKDQAMLKEIVDESSFGKYDFMYLRIGESKVYRIRSEINYI